MNLFIILQLSASLLGTEPDSINNQSKALDEVVVTALRTESKIIDIPSSVTAVDEDYINTRLSRTTPEILMGTTGVFVQNSNAY